MKKAYLLTALLLLSAIAWGQQWDWARSFEVPVHIQHVFRNTDQHGSFYATGGFHHTVTIDNHSLNEYGQHRFLGRFDSTGSCTWLMKLPDSLRSIAADRYGNFYILQYFISSMQAGDTAISSSAPASFCLIKYRPDQTIEWIRKGDLFSAIQRFDITIDNNQDVILSIGYNDSLSFNGNWAYPVAGDNTWIAKLSGSGATEWTTVIGNALIWNILPDRLNDLVIVAAVYDTSYFGNIIVPYYSEFAGHYYLAKYSANGNPIWVKSMWSDYKEDTPKLDFDSNSNIYVVHNTPYEYSSLTKYTPDLDTIWNKGSQIFSQVMIDEYDRVFFSGGNFNDAIVCGDTVPSITSTYGQLDTDGNCIWQRTLVPGNYSRNAWVAIAAFVNYNKIYAVGSNNIPFSLDNIPIPGDTFTTFFASMTLPGDPPSLAMEEEHNTEFTIYPNPASDELNLTAVRGIIIIRDITGRQVYRNEIAAAGQTIRLDNFCDGVYIVEVSDGVKKICRKLIVQR